jgi:hypothetical protein
MKLPILWSVLVVAAATGIYVMCYFLFSILMKMVYHF